MEGTVAWLPHIRERKCPNFQQDRFENTSDLHRFEMFLLIYSTIVSCIKQLNVFLYSVSRSEPAVWQEPFRGSFTVGSEMSKLLPGSVWKHLWCLRFKAFLPSNSTVTGCVKWLNVLFHIVSGSKLVAWRKLFHGSFAVWSTNAQISSNIGLKPLLIYKIWNVSTPLLNWWNGLTGRSPNHFPFDSRRHLRWNWDLGDTDKGHALRGDEKPRQMQKVTSDNAIITLFDGFWYHRMI